MLSDASESNRLANISLCTVPLAMLMAIIGTKGLQSQDDSPAVLLVVAVALIAGLTCGMLAYRASRKFWQKRLFVKATVGIVLNILFLAFMAGFLYAAS